MVQPATLQGHQTSVNPLVRRHAPKNTGGALSRMEARPAPSLQRLVGNQALQRRVQAGSLTLSPQAIQGFIQRSIVQRSGGVGAAGGPLDEELQSRIMNERGRGRPLDRNVGEQMGAALGSDFGGVRVHTDGTSDKLNRSLNATAFTLGNDVFFRNGAYKPGQDDGQRLIAHELTHVVQQGAAARHVQKKPLMVGPAHDHFEAEADQVAAGVAAGRIQAHPAQEEEVQRAPAPYFIQRHVQFDPLEKDAQDADDEVQESRTTSTKGKKGATGGLSFKTLDKAYAQKAIKKKFGKTKKGDVITGDVVIIDTRDALYAKQDEVEKRSNPDWPDGQCKKLATDGGYDVNGFAELPPKTEVYVYGGGPDPTATVHEMLHINTIPQFLDNVGRVINEGITQRLAMAAVKGTGQKTKGSEGVYPDEQAVVKELVKVVPEKTLINAYFNDAKLIPTEYDKVKGTGAFAQLKALLDQNKYEDGKTMIKAKVPKPAKEDKSAKKTGSSSDGNKK